MSRPVRLAPAVLSLVLLAAACGPQEVHELHARRVTEATPARLVVESFQGHVTVEASAVGGVDLEADKWARAVTEAGATAALHTVRVSAREEADGTLRVRVLAEDAQVPHDALGVALRLRVPAGLDVEVQTRDGDVDVDVPVRALAVRTTEGAVRVAAADGPVGVEAQDGPVDVAGRVAALEVRTTNGAVTFTGALGEGVVHVLRTTHAPLTVRLPADAAFEVEARGARVRSDFAVEGERAEGLVRGAVGARPAFGLRLETTHAGVVLAHVE